MALNVEFGFWSPIRWADFSRDWTLKEDSTWDDGPSVSELSEREKINFSGEDNRDCEWWCKIAEIELDVDLLREDDEDWVGRFLNL